MCDFVYMHFSPSDFGVCQNRFATDNIPEYQFFSMKQTRSLNKDARIIFICNSDRITHEQYDIIKELNINIFDYHIEDNLLKEYYSTMMNSNGKVVYDPFYKVTFLRYVFTEIAMKKFNINDMMFVEGDNILYISDNELFEQIQKYKDSVTTCGRTGPGYYSSGVFYCNGVEQIQKFNLLTMQYLKDGYNIDDMSIINILKTNKDINLMEFPCIPSEENIIFDPSSYGQFLGGDNRQKKPGYINETHLVGKFIIDNGKDISFFKQNSRFYLKLKDKTYEFANLHIHNKDAIKDFITHG